MTEVDTDHEVHGRVSQPWTGAVGAAVEFVAAQPDGPARLLAHHVRRDDGLCAGCATGPVRWPCVAATIADAAVRRAG